MMAGWVVPLGLVPFNALYILFPLVSYLLCVLHRMYEMLLILLLLLSSWAALFLSCFYFILFFIFFVFFNLSK